MIVTHPSITAMDSTAHVDGPVRTILVPTDGSDAAEAALEHAGSIADAAEASVHVLAVVDTTDAPSTFDVAFVDALERAKRRLADGLDGLDNRDIDGTGAVLRGRPAQTIVRYADEHEVDLIVLGRTGQSGLVAPLLGSTTNRVVRTSPVPVMVVSAEMGRH
jgi:nucleotide-binding universal stress UspA family protein